MYVVGLVLQQTRVLKAAFEAARMHENPRALQVQAGLGGWCGLTAWVFLPIWAEEQKGHGESVPKEAESNLHRKFNVLLFVVGIKILLKSRMLVLSLSFLCGRILGYLASYHLVLLFSFPLWVQLVCSTGPWKKPAPTTLGGSFHLLGWGMI